MHVQINNIAQKLGLEDIHTSTAEAATGELSSEFSVLMHSPVQVI